MTTDQQGVTDAYWASLEKSLSGEYARVGDTHCARANLDALVRAGWTPPEPAPVERFTTKPSPVCVEVFDGTTLMIDDYYGSKEGAQAMGLAPDEVSVGQWHTIVGSTLQIANDNEAGDLYVYFEDEYRTVDQLAGLPTWKQKLIRRLTGRDLTYRAGPEQHGMRLGPGATVEFQCDPSTAQVIAGTTRSYVSITQRVGTEKRDK